jgi:L-ascorbate metabolism protein UlaG (beta-lactamase superfamily)
VSSDGLRVTWLGHSTMLLELDGARVLTDPVFGERASPLGFAGPRRFHPVPATIAELPPLDAVLLSHDHFDHLCKASVRELAARRVPFVTSLGVGAHLEAYGVEPGLITELDWWESTTCGRRLHRDAGAALLGAQPDQAQPHACGRRGCSPPRGGGCSSRATPA